MTVWNVDKNAEAKTMVITAEFKTSITNVWQLWADPRLLERWWGPPGFPATFEHHDLTPGGTITYFMSGPDGGDRFDGTWNVVEVDAPTRLVVEDAIVEDDGTPSDGNSMTRMEIDIEAAGDTTRMILTTHFDSLEGMEQAIAMGVVEGMKAWHVPDRRPARRGRRLGDYSQRKNLAATAPPESLLGHIRQSPARVAACQTRRRTDQSICDCPRTSPGEGPVGPARAGWIPNGRRQISLGQLGHWMATRHC